MLNCLKITPEMISETSQLVRHFFGYSEEGEIGYKIFISEHKIEIVIGFHVLFNVIVSSYSESYYQACKNNVYIAIC